MTTPNTTVGAVMAKAALFGSAGWAVENMVGDRPRYSLVFGGRQIPFLPIYAIGGLTMLAAAPRLAKSSLLVKALAYAAIGTAVEYVGCQLDRRAFDSKAWDYGKIDGLASATDGCLSWKHTALWGGLGLLAEQFA